ncbi:MAG: C10 family peptidase, partial [Planctomycetota bacterium]
MDPVDGLRSYVGCVATAMAQIVNYHRQCNLHFDVSDSYTSIAGIDIDGDSALYDFPSFGELNGHLLAVQSKYGGSVDLDDADAAALSFACGIASEM